MPAVPAYLSGLRLSGRRVVVIGAGRVAERRLDRLLEAGAELIVIAPVATELIKQLADSGRLTWLQRGYLYGDLEGAWYALVATDDHDCNERVSTEAEQRRIFCVRSDDRQAATAWTPASAVTDGVQIGVLAGGDHGRSRRIRDELLRQLDL
ncbi:bifunctional precorrin-2 dehydrogenase/sirohydrochlorin ferrochelatase [Microlunatus sp. Gsoil 973]|uniref:precorrin-2 dehydrogenase/sirohydrochlorin ferrochelatase family protein n=1 Tax=Microlunatus sp. Gsoil 973 TaxID=2672569 RepID=UPI001E563C57|nr:bifunctional precorrin-2 dehydrogenase/sirohydrochlorin ferrochelatase [Microlunatus sp. Gsoil 973]